MASSLTLHRTPDAGFDRPFEMLTACHERVERMLRLLERLQQHLSENGPDQQAQDAARDLLRYFDHAAVQHHLDEETHVLPLLRKSGRRELASRLQTDHERMSTSWALLRIELQAVAQAAAACPDAGPAGRLATQVPGFTTLYREHVKLEEHEAYPLAAAQTGPSDLARMGGEMAARRGLR